MEMPLRSMPLRDLLLPSNGSPPPPRIPELKPMQRGVLVSRVEALRHRAGSHLFRRIYNMGDPAMNTAILQFSRSRRFYSS